MVKKLSVKQQRIVKAKVEGKKHKEVAAVEYPQATPQSGEVLVSRELKKPHVAKYYEQLKEKALTKHGIDIERIIDIYAEGATATKGVIIGNGEEAMIDWQPDHTTRMRAAKELERFLPKDNQSTPSPLLEEALNNGDVDEVQLIRLIKNS